jgi:Family of unknown function (DUF5752)
MKEAEHPFQFATSPFLIRICNQVAYNLLDFRDGLEHASDASIFHHTFQSLGRHHFLTEGFSSDFAQWVLAALNRASLAERLAGIDVRDYVSIAELRADLLRMVNEYCEQQPDDAKLAAFEPFHFCEAVEVIAPLDLVAHNLLEFRNGVMRLSHASFYHHWIASRLRLHLKTNDFANWLDTGLGLAELARRTDRIDIYTNTLDSARLQMIGFIDEELNDDRK